MNFMIIYVLPLTFFFLLDFLYFVGRRQRGSISCTRRTEVTQPLHGKVTEFLGSVVWYLTVLLSIHARRLEVE